MTFNDEQIRELLPLYRTGRLANAQEQAIAATLAESPELAQEYAEILEIRGCCDSFAAEVAPPEDELFARIRHRIEEEKGRSPVLPLKSNAPGIVEKLRVYFSSPQLSWSLVAVQFALLVVLLVGISRPPEILTLGLNPPSAAKPRINLVFQENTLEIEMRKLLRAIDGEIVAGPSDTGLYVVSLKNQNSIQSALEFLRTQPQVRLAERQV